MSEAFAEEKEEFIHRPRQDALTHKDRFLSSDRNTPESNAPDALKRHPPRLAQVFSEEIQGAVGMTGGSILQTLKYLMQVQLRATIKKAATKWNIHPLAIVGAVSWEAIENPRYASVRGGGSLGKIHYRENFPPFGEGTPLAKQLEDLGYLPRADMESRRKNLSDPKVAIEYLGASFHAFSVLAEKHGYSIRENLGVLGFAYNAMKLDTWDRHIERKKPDPLRAGEMGIWIEDGIDFLRDIYPDKSWKLEPLSSMDPEIRKIDERLVARKWD